MVFKLLFVAVVVFLMNIPFGYWRSNVSKFSLQWILAIHLPVPIIVFLRIVSHIGFAWYTYVFLIGAFFFGQKVGTLIYDQNLNRIDEITSCLFADLMRVCKKCR